MSHDPPGPSTTQLPEAETAGRIREYLAPLALFLLAAVLFAGYLLRAKPGFHVDVERYVYLAYCLRTGDFAAAINYHYPPGFPALIALFCYVIPTVDLAARVAGLLCTALTVVPIYFLARDLFGKRTAVFAAMLFSCRFLPQLGVLSAEQVVMPLITAGMWSGWRSWRSGRARGALITGLIFGASFLVKSEAGSYLASYVLILLAGPAIARPRKRYAEKKSPGPAFAAALIGGYFLVCSFYLILYYLDTGMVSLNPKARTLFLIHNYYYSNDMLYHIYADERGLYTPAERIIIEGDKIPYPEPLLPKLWHDRGELSITYVKRFFISARRNLAGYYFQSIIPWLWPVPLIAGLWPAPKGKRWPELYLHAFAVIPLLAVPAFNTTFPRFYLTLLPWMMIVLGRGTDRLIRLGETRLPARLHLKTWAAGAIAVVMLMSAGVSISRASLDVVYWSRFQNRMQAASGLKKMLPEQCRFMAELENPSIWFLAMIPPDRMEIIPNAPLPEVINFARHKRVRFLVFFKSEFPDRYRGLWPLLEPGFSHPDLNLRLRFSGSDGLVYVIYEIPSVSCVGPGP